MITDRGPWSQTYTGRMFHHRDPRPEDIAIEDIAHALALQCRFGGHCRVPYSIAEHSVRVAAVAFGLAHADGIEPDGRRSITLAGLMHDASEAYLVDVPRPVKGDLGGYREIEADVQGAIVRRFRCAVGESWMRYVKRADEILLATEARDLMGPPADDWYLTEAPLGEVIAPWSWHVAEASFLHRFNDMCRPEDRVTR